VCVKYHYHWASIVHVMHFISTPMTHLVIHFSSRSEKKNVITTNMQRELVACVSGKDLHVSAFASKKTCSENVKVRLFLISTRAESECSNDRIHRAHLTDGSEVMEWSVAGGPRGLSVNKAHNVVVACWKEKEAGNQFSIHMRIAMDQHVLLSIVRK